MQLFLSRKAFAHVEQQKRTCALIHMLCDPRAPDNVPTTAQTQPDQKAGLVRTEWISLSRGTVPGPLGTEQTPRECVPPPPPLCLTIKAPLTTPTSYQMSAPPPSPSVQFPVSLDSCVLPPTRRNQESSRWSKPDEVYLFVYLLCDLLHTCQQGQPGSELKLDTC